MDRKSERDSGLAIDNPGAEQSFVKKMTGQHFTFSPTGNIS